MIATTLYLPSFGSSTLKRLYNVTPPIVLAVLSRATPLSFAYLFWLATVTSSIVISSGEGAPQLPNLAFLNEDAIHTTSHKRLLPLVLRPGPGYKKCDRLFLI